MTKEEIRIAVAKEMGWSNLHYSTTHELMGRKAFSLVHRVVPNYPEDLNACREFEDQFILDDSKNGYYRYIDELLKIAKNWGPRASLDRPCFLATARQRCIAFLKVKYMEEKQ